ncbi:MAG: thioredoxin domain-containing protein [Snowella sp.]|nr:thioredoxin domain-containing protein [Snowella sp.]
MKIKQLASLAAIAILSTGVATVATYPQIALQVLSAALESKAMANPYANSKTETSVGGPLSKSLQGKPVVVDIYATWCSACKNIAPTLSQLKQQYAGKVHFVVLDVSDKASTAKSEAKAKELGLSKFFEANKTQTGSLTIIDPKTGQILSQHRNNPNKSAYTTVLDNAIAKK